LELIRRICRAFPGADEAELQGRPLSGLVDGASRSSTALRHLLGPGDSVFIPAGVVILIGLFLKFGVGVRRAFVTAVVATLVIHLLFYKLLRVPLPWGVLERFAW
jgi:hypothetical protein